MWLDKTKAVLIELYPGLARHPEFNKLNQTLFVTIDNRYKTIIRIALPISILLVVIATGISIGQTLNRAMIQNPIILPAPPSITPIPTVEYHSPIETNLQNIENFNPALPDPIQPVLDYQMTLDPVKK